MNNDLKNYATQTKSEKFYHFMMQSSFTIYTFPELVALNRILRFVSPLLTLNTKYGFKHTSHHEKR